MTLISSAFAQSPSKTSIHDFQEITKSKARLDQMGTYMEQAIKTGAIQTEAQQGKPLKE